MMDTIAAHRQLRRRGAQSLAKVPSALTYNVRQLEDALDVLLFDRSSRRAAHRHQARNCSRGAGACSPRWTRWPIACAASPPAGRRSSRWRGHHHLAGHRVRAVRGLLRAAASRASSTRHAAARAQRGAGRHLGGAAVGPADLAIGVGTGMPRRRQASSSRCWATSTSSSRSRRTIRWRITRGRSAMPNCCATARWQWPIRRSA